MTHPISQPPHANVWLEFKEDFLCDWTDVTEEYKACEELSKLSQKEDQVDHYITRFAELMRKAKYNLENEALWEQFKKGLTPKTRELITYHDDPQNWDDLCQVART